MLELFLITLLAGYISTVAGNVTSDAIHDAKVNNNTMPVSK